MQKVLGGLWETAPPRELRAKLWLFEKPQKEGGESEDGAGGGRRGGGEGSGSGGGS